MKNNSGVTLVELAIVLVIMMMIAAFAVNSGRKTLNEADATELLTDFSSMKNAVNSIIAQRNMDEDFHVEEGKHYDAAFPPSEGYGATYGSNVLDDPSNWYTIYGKEDASKYNSSSVKDNLGLSGINHTYIVNYETNSVELYRPQTVSGVTVRTYEEVRNLANNS